MGTYANFYNSDNGDRVYDADSFSEWLRPFFKTGVFNGELQVLASSGMEVIVDTGNAFIEGKLKKFDSQTTLTVEQASANSTRIDAVICRRDDTNRDFTLMVVKGSTVAPLPVRENGIYDIVLAHITVPASAVEIKQENITDTRMNADICGWVVSNIEEVDFDQVTTQWADYIANFEVNELQAFNEWFDTIKGQLSTDQAGSLQLQIDEQANKIATNTANISANKADIDANSADITSLQQTTSKNTSDIATNKANIATNTSNIATNKANIATNTNNIAKLNTIRVNLLKPTLGTKTSNGVTCTNNGDTYTVNGTASANALFIFYSKTKNNFIGKKLLGCPYIKQGRSGPQLYISLWKQDDSWLKSIIDDGDGVIIDDGYYIEISIFIPSGYTCNNLLFKPMLTTNLNATYDDFIACLGTSWTQDTTNGYYTQTIACNGITSNDNPTIDVVLSGNLTEMQSQQEEWGKILKIETSTDTLKFYASEPTTVSLSVMVKGV